MDYDAARPREWPRVPTKGAVVRPRLATALVLSSLAGAGHAYAQAQGQRSDSAVPRLGLDPGEPQAPSPPPALPFGVQPAQSKELVLDFHGYLLLPMEL